MPDDRRRRGDFPTPGELTAGGGEDVEFTSDAGETPFRIGDVGDRDRLADFKRGLWPP